MTRCLKTKKSVSISDSRGSKSEVDLNSAQPEADGKEELYKIKVANFDALLPFLTDQKLLEFDTTKEV
jgi:hypothetical protein